MQSKAQVQKIAVLTVLALAVVCLSSVGTSVFAIVHGGGPGAGGHHFFRGDRDFGFHGFHGFHDFDNFGFFGGPFFYNNYCYSVPYWIAVHHGCFF